MGSELDDAIKVATLKTTLRVSDGYGPMPTSINTMKVEDAKWRHVTTFLIEKKHQQVKLKETTQ